MKNVEQISQTVMETPVTEVSYGLIILLYFIGFMSMIIFYLLKYQRRKDQSKKNVFNLKKWWKENNIDFILSAASFITLMVMFGTPKILAALYEVAGMEIGGALSYIASVLGAGVLGFSSTAIFKKLMGKGTKKVNDVIDKAIK